MAWVPWTLWPCGRYGHFRREKWWGFGGPGLFLGNTDVGWVFEVRSSLEMVRSWETTRWDTPTALGISCSRSCQSCVCWFRLTPLADMGRGRLFPYDFTWGNHQLYQPFQSTGRVLGFWLIAKYSIFTSWNKQPNHWVLRNLTTSLSRSGGSPPRQFISCLKSDSNMKIWGWVKAYCTILYHILVGWTSINTTCTPILVFIRVQGFDS